MIFKVLFNADCSVVLRFYKGASWRCSGQFSSSNYAEKISDDTNLVIHPLLIHRDSDISEKQGFLRYTQIHPT